jgi:hypothetical protein
MALDFHSCSILAKACRLNLTLIGKWLLLSRQKMFSAVQ